MDHYSTESLEADIAAGGYGVTTHPRQARELLRLDTPKRRARAMAEAHTLSNLQGGIISGNLYYAVRDLLANIESGNEDAELYGERVAREAREREAALREATGNASAIYFHPALKRA